MGGSNYNRILTMFVLLVMLDTSDLNKNPIVKKWDMFEGSVSECSQ